MPRTAFLSTGFHVPARVVTNDDLAKIMDTSDEWIVQRTGIKTRYWVDKGDTGVALAREASKKALDKAGLAPADIDCIIYCTCTPDHFEPGDGAGAAVLGPISDDGRGVLSTHIFADGRYAEKLWVDGPGLAHDPYVSVEMLEQGLHRAVMEGRDVFKFASLKMPESVAIALKTNRLTPADVKLLVPHQANQRIIEMVQKAAGLREDQVYSNIQKYGNTTAASIPIALDEALAEGRLKRGDLLVLTAFGSGFTWGSAAIRW